MKRDILAPEIVFPLVAIGFLAISLIGAKVYSYYTVTGFSVFLSLAATAVFIAGARFARELEINERLALGLILLAAIPYLARNMDYIVPFLLGLSAVYLIKREPERLAFLMLASGTVLFIAYVLLNGIPLIDQSLRAGGYTPLWAAALALYSLGFNIRAYKAGRKEFLLLALAGLAVFLLGGYRGALMLIAASALFAAYYRGFLDLKVSSAVALAALILITIAGMQASSLGLSPAGLFLNRAAFTSSIEDRIMRSEPAGMGLWLEKNPRFAIGEIFVGHAKSINAGLFGSLWLTGGYVLLMGGMLLIGMAAGYMHKKRENFPAAYSIGLAFLLLAIEAGLDLNAILYLLGLVWLCTDRR